MANEQYPKAVYLGDSVYVELDENARVKLTTNNGYPDDPRNVIIMEPEVLEAFNRWVAGGWAKPYQKEAK